MAAARGEIGSAFLLRVEGDLSAWELECLRDIGIEGVVVNLDTRDAARLKTLGQAISDLPRRKPRNEFSSPSLPRVSAHDQVIDGDDDDEDEGDDDSE